jgi:ankyrin repeat protein
MIIDYVGLAVGMPKSVADLEAAIDATAGTERWVRGTPETVEILKKQNFNFKSKSAYEMLVEAVDRPAFFKALIAAGVPVTPDRSDGSSRPILSALTAAVSLGDREAFAILIAEGAAKNLPPAEADELLLAAAKNADPQLIKTVLELAPDSVFSTAAKVEALKEASGNRFDKHGAVAILLAAGADPNRLDVKGETVFDWISDPAIAAQIIAAGADLNRKNKSGLIPLLSNHNEETTLYLMKVTKPGIADPLVARALKKRAEQFEFKKVLAQLHRHHRTLASPR